SAPISMATFPHCFTPLRLASRLPNRRSRAAFTSASLSCGSSPIVAWRVFCRDSDSPYRVNTIERLAPGSVKFSIHRAPAEPLYSHDDPWPSFFRELGGLRSLLRG